jgi:hypothetical protein
MNLDDGDLVAVAGMHNDAATTLLAIYHWNTRNNDNDNDNCNIRCTADLLDSQSNPNHRQQVTRVMNDQILPNQETVTLIGEYDFVLPPLRLPLPS